ncbi:hypothetical protein BGZ92_005518 [Podila epicladia]|nr:hypothetical protein BGZ92_005518 [Podila epicladia]
MMTSDVPRSSEASSSAINTALPSTPFLSQERTTLSQPAESVVTNSFATMQLATDPVMEAKAHHPSARSNGEVTTLAPYSAPMSEEEEAKLENAATLIQSAYRGYQ